MEIMPNAQLLVISKDPESGPKYLIYKRGFKKCFSHLYPLAKSMNNSGK